MTKLKSEQPSNELINIFHISDLHFGAEPYDGVTNSMLQIRENVLNNLILTVSELPDNLKPNLVVVSGDISWKADKNDFAKAIDWLTRLSNSANVLQENFIFCPGNHDIDRKEANFSVGIDNVEISKKHLSIENISRRKNHYKNYLNFCMQFGTLPFSNNAIDDDEQLIKYIYGYRELYGIDFIVLNSSWCCLDGNDLGKLWIGERLVLDARSCIPQNNDRVKITIFHHPLNNTNIAEQRVFSDEPISQDAILDISDIILNGHVHGEIRNGTFAENKAYVLTSGATYKPDTYKLACQIIQIDTKKYEYSTQIIYLPPSSREWKIKQGEVGICFRICNKKNERFNSKLVKNFNEEYNDNWLDISNLSNTDNYINREDLNNEFKDLLSKHNVIMIIGLLGSGKKTFIKSFFKNKVSSKQWNRIIIYYAEQNESIEDFFLNFYKLCGLKNFSGVRRVKEFIDYICENRIVIIINNFDKMNINTFKVFLNIAYEYKNGFNIIMLSSVFLENIAGFSSFGKLNISGYTREEVRQYIFNKNILPLTEEEIDKLMYKTHGLPLAIEVFCSLIKDLNNTPEMLLKDTLVDQSEILYSWCERIMARFDLEYLDIFKKLSFYEIPFNKNLILNISNERKKSLPKFNIFNLQKTLLLSRVTKYRWNVHTLFSDYCKSKTSEKEQISIDILLAKYCIENSLSKYAKNDFNTKIKWASKACYHFQRAKKYEESEKILFNNRKNLKKYGYYDLFISLLDKQKIRDNYGSWLFYDFLHCCLITGKVNKAVAIMKKHLPNINDINNSDLKLSIARIYSEILSEQNYNVDGLNILQEYIKSCSDASIKILNHAYQIKSAILIKLGLYEEAEKNIDEHFSNNDSYGQAIALIRKGIINEKRKENKAIDKMNFNDALNVFIAKKDIRAQGWALMHMGLHEIYFGDQKAGCDYISRSIDIKEKINECSNDYISSLNELKNLIYFEQSLIDKINDELIRINMEFENCCLF